MDSLIQDRTSRFVKMKFLMVSIFIAFLWRFNTTQERNFVMTFENRIESDYINRETVDNDFTIEQSFARRKQVLKRACRYLGKIIGVWISGSIQDLIHFHGLLYSTMNSDNDLEDFLLRFESMQIENVIDRVKTDLVRWVTSEKIGKNCL